MLQLSFSTDELELFLLVLVRISMFFVIAPFFSMTNAPNRVKIGLSVLLSVLIYSSLQDRTPVTYHSILGYTLIVLKEAVTGLLIGFAATLVTSVVSLAGNIVDMESGLSMMQIMDPATKQEWVLPVYHHADDAFKRSAPLSDQGNCGYICFDSH